MPGDRAFKPIKQEDLTPIEINANKAFEAAAKLIAIELTEKLFKIGVKLINGKIVIGEEGKKLITKATLVNAELQIAAQKKEYPFDSITPEWLRNLIKSEISKEILDYYSDKKDLKIQQYQKLKGFGEETVKQQLDLELRKIYSKNIMLEGLEEKETRRITAIKTGTLNLKPDETNLTQDEKNMRDLISIRDARIAKEQLEKIRQDRLEEEARKRKSA